MVLWFFPTPFLAKCGVRETGTRFQEAEATGFLTFFQLSTRRVAAQNWKKCATLALLCLLWTRLLYFRWNKCFLWNQSAGQGDIKHLLLLSSNTSPTRRDHLSHSSCKLFVFSPVEMSLFEEEEPALNNLFRSYCGRVLFTYFTVFHTSFLAGLCLKCVTPT